jgi:hypothetical protein
MMMHGLENVKLFNIIPLTIYSQTGKHGSHIALTTEINICTHSFPLPMAAYKIILATAFR